VRQWAIDAPPCPGLRPVRWRAALAVSIVVTALAGFALLFPAPTGPPDNGDFIRIFEVFSTGPEGMPPLPAHVDLATRGRRYFHFYLRYWRLGHRVRRFAHPSSSLLCYVPGLVLRLRQGYFDLASNAAMLVVLLAAGLGAVLKRLEPLPFMALGACALLMTDANVVGYLNSFYQESGAVVGLAGLTAALFLFWTRRRPRDAALVAIFTAMLCSTKTAYAIAAIAPVPVMLGALREADERLPSKESLCAGAGAVAVVIFTFFSWTSRDFITDHAYHFLFTAALPSLPAAERGPFLGEVGVDPRFAFLSGRNAYQAESHSTDPALAPALTRETHGRAVRNLLVRHPRSLFRILARSFSLSGRYAALAYSSAGGPMRRRPDWALWTRFRTRHWRGALPYAAWLLLLLLAVRRRTSAPKSAERFFLLLAAGYGSASVLQIVVSVLGNGFADIQKHHFLGNVLLDIASVAVVAGAIETARRASRTAFTGRWKARFRQDGKPGLPAENEVTTASC